MPAAKPRVGGWGLGVLIHLGGLVLVLAVLGGILAIDRSGDRAKQAQLLVSQIESRLSLVQSVPWDVDPEAADVPLAEVRTAMAAASRDIRANLNELGDIDPTMRRLLALERENADLLIRQLPAVQAGDEDGANEISGKAFDVFVKLRSELNTAALRFNRSAASASRYTLVGTAILMLVLYAAFALTLATLRGVQRQRAAQSERLRQSQKMEAVGQLAGGVAHDFNNLLTAISGYSELALARLDEDSDPGLREDIEEIAVSGERAAQLTRQLLALSRRQTLQSAVFDLNKTVSGIESLLKRLLRTDVSIATRLSSTDCFIQADQGQIEQVIMNLAVNARDAMPEGGVLRIETETMRLSTADAGRRFQAPGGDYVVLRVADDGLGMDEATRLRAFEPFYTTKPLGEGTGLGLATVYGIVAQSGGFISLDSEVDAGTTFELLLPRVAVPVPAPIAGPALSSAKTGGGERILLVEDEAAVRNLTRAILTRGGYDVVVAAEGHQALELSREHPFDLVITDMVMPKMSGKLLAENLRSERPDLPIIFISGYAYDLGAAEMRAGDAFLQKPFSAGELSAAARASIDRRAGADRSPRAA